MSIIDVENFVDSVHRFNGELANVSPLNPQLAAKVKDIMLIRPYYLFAMFLEMCTYTGKPNKDYLLSCF